MSSESASPETIRHCAPAARYPAGGGAWLGGLALGAGYGYVSPLWIGAGVTVAGLVVLVAGSMRPHRRVPGAAPAAVTASG
ncbi:hypothetical protein [Nonomuraea sp. NPDC049480]|uniref:hypothetical protein n=1 Tax=Nonomuraea sp. NPDC049480 TaxID=3364353 RepID=UPI0037A0DACE